MNKRIKKKLLSKQQQYVYGAIGFVFHLTSLIEYNLIQIIAGEKYLSVFDKEEFSFEDIENAMIDSNKELHNLSNSKNMLGKLIDKIESVNVFDKDFINDLRKASQIRGYYAHQFFKDDLYKGYMEKDPLRYKKRMSDDIGFLYQLNYGLTDMDKENRKLARMAKGVIL